MPAFFDLPEPRHVAPGEYPWWDRALALLNQDLAVTLPQQKPLRLRALPPVGGDEAEQVCVTLANGDWHGNYLCPSSADDAASALAAVADAGQETVIECLWQVWPLCTEHGLGAHPRDAEGQLVWWCAGERQRDGRSHILARVGALDTLIRPHRPHRKPKPGSHPKSNPKPKRAR
ncbi:hypothetical protein [Streptomyces sp. NPDC051569]|uniref:hypothetical protein n=1 Tax=Streptomyces sp. NPDC051569 TaxID=3365661 RepID=UPI0037948B87